MDSEPQPITSSSADPAAVDRLEETLWVIRARDGDMDAFENLIATHEKPLFYYLRRFIRQPETASDASQDVWLEVHRGLRHLQTPQAFRAWLYRIAHGKAMRFIRAELRAGGATEPLDATHETLAEEDETQLDAEAVHKALDRLPPLQREALTLHYLRDLTLEEMAAALDCPTGTIKSRLHHARIALRRMLERKPHE